MTPLMAGGKRCVSSYCPIWCLSIYKRTMIIKTCRKLPAINCT